MRTSEYMACPGYKIVNSSIKNIILYEVLCYFGIDFTQLKQKKRFREVVNRRNIYYYLLDDYGVFNLNGGHWESKSKSKLYQNMVTKRDVGNEMGQNHATVWHGINSVKTYIEYDKVLKNDVEKIKAKIRYRLELIEQKETDNNYSVNN